MPSPFPGMNPYLEQASVWTDFHTRFLDALSEVIARQVAPKYLVRIDHELYIHEWANPFARGDAVVADGGGRPGPSPGGTATLTPSVPVFVPAPLPDVERIPYLEITTKDGKRVVTVIELLSRANKYSGPDRDAFQAKRFALLQRAVHYLELDLLRGGPRMPIPDMPDCDYYAFLSRFPHRPRGDFWPIQLPDRLPTIPIPLMSTDADATADLQAVLNTVYDRACYEHSIYAGGPEPALSKDDAAWAAQFVPPPPA